MTSQVIPVSNNGNTVSIYHGDLTKETLVKQISRIITAFPKMQKDTLDLLRDRIKQNGFNDERFIAACDYVIDNYDSWNQTPPIAAFIKFDKRVPVYTWEKSIEIGQHNCVTVDVGLDKPRWILKEYFEKYKFKKWNKK